MTRRRAWLAGVVVALLLSGCGGSDAAVAPTPQQARDRSLVRSLRAGGLVLVMRHTPADVKTDAQESLRSCSRQRALTVTGRDQARAIGSAIRRLRIPIGEVRASPLCRARDTARLMIGRVTLDRDLVSPGVIGAPADDARRSRALLALAQAPPKAGTDSLIVTHATNIGSAFELSVQEGEVLAFRPQPGAKSPKLVARVRAEDWPRLATGG